MHIVSDNDHSLPPEQDVHDHPHVSEADLALGYQLLKAIDGENPDRPGLVETPARFMKAFKEWTSGYHEDPEAILKTFEDGAEGVSEMVMVRNIPVYSLCEHHMATIFGVAHVGYIPNGRIVGLSKIPRVVNIFARRLQVQERLTNQIAEAIDEVLQPHGVAVVLDCRHMCMESRGVHIHGEATTRTAARRGVYKDNLRYFHEFLPQIKA
jgi:GTP cyclohydrolase IA